jgi:hypothetical protein
LCAAAAGAVGWPDDAAVIDRVGDVVVLLRPGLQEVLVAPSVHVPTLGDLSEAHQGQLLGTLRRLVSVLGAEGHGTTVERATGQDWTSNHLCIRVLSGHRDEATSSSDPAALARELHHMIR